MIDYDQLYRCLGIDEHLAAGFFIVFSRFEYALKRTPGYASESTNDVRPDWDKFANDHDARFDRGRTDELETAVDYLLNNPPEKQVLSDGVLGWKPVPGENVPLLRQLLCVVRRVRNNLFHGGKFPPPFGPVAEPGRNSALLQSCVIVLEESLSLSRRVKANFHEHD